MTRRFKLSCGHTVLDARGLMKIGMSVHCPICKKHRMIEDAAHQKRP